MTPRPASWRGRPTPSPARASRATRPGRATPGCAAAPRTWQTGAYDAETNTLFWGTGNPGPWNSDLRKGDNLWSCSLLALDPDTGAIKWGYQYTPNDAWDYDGNNAPILIDVDDRRPAGQGGGAVEPQRLPLRARPDHRRVHLRRADHRGHQLDHRPRPQGRPAEGQRGDAPDQRRRDDRADRARPRGRHQLVPDGLQPGARLRVLRHQPLGDGADRLEARGRRVQGRRAATWASTTRCTGSRTTSATSRRSTSRTRSSSGSGRARCRCSPACSRPRAASCSPAISWASSRRSTPRPARCCGSSRPAPGSTPRRSPTSSTAPSTSRSSRAWAAIRASTSRAPRAACSGCSRWRARSPRAAA